MFIRDLKFSHNVNMSSIHLGLNYGRVLFNFVKMFKPFTSF